MYHCRLYEVVFSWLSGKWPTSIICSSSPSFSDVSCEQMWAHITDTEYKKLVEIRRKQRWEKPRKSQCVDHVTNVSHIFTGCSHIMRLISSDTSRRTEKKPDLKNLWSIFLSLLNCCLARKIITLLKCQGRKRIWKALSHNYGGMLYITMDKTSFILLRQIHLRHNHHGYLATQKWESLVWVLDTSWTAADKVSSSKHSPGGNTKWCENWLWAPHQKSVTWDEQ